MARKKIPLSNFTRYITFARYSTLKRNVNFLKAIFFWLVGKERISSMPAFLKVEISRKCSVKCLYCFERKADVFYPLEAYKELVDKLKDYIYLVSLYDIGEPLENKDVIKYIRHGHERGIGTIISTSLSIRKNDAFWEELVNSGLDKIIVAIDGITPEVYNRYRTNGDRDLVMSNLKKILHYRRKSRSKIVVEWQMIDLPWNKHEQNQARLMAKRMGCVFRIIKDTSQPRREYERLNVIRKKNCVLPYIILIVTAYGKVRPCYKVYNAPMEIGDVNRETVKQIWNGDAIREIRSKRRIRHRQGCRTCQE